MICLSRRAKHAEYLLSLEREASSQRDRQIDRQHGELKDLRTKLEASRDIATALRAQLEKALAERDEARSQRDASTLYAGSKEGYAKSWQEAAQREQGKAESAGVVLRDTEEKLRKAELALDLSRDRREEIGKQLDSLRIQANATAITAREAADFLSLSSNPGSEARMHAECVYDDLAGLDAVLNS